MKNDILDIEIPGVKTQVITTNFDYPFNQMIEGLSNREYHNAFGLSSTRFGLIDLSVRAFKNRKLFDTWKPCFDKGNLIHDSILLPGLVETTYIESPTIGLDTVAAKKLRESNPEKIIVGQGDIEEYKYVAKLANVMFPFLAYPSTKKEVSFFHHNKDLNEVFQIRPDIYNPEVGMLYDVKSTKANNHTEFEKLIEGYNYDLSLAFYFDVLQMCGYKTNIFYTGWLCIPTAKPNIPFVFRISEELMEKGRSKYQRLLEKLIRYEEAVKREGETDELIYNDVAEREAHSWEYRRNNYIGENNE